MMNKRLNRNILMLIISLLLLNLGALTLLAQESDSWSPYKYITEQNNEWACIHIDKPQFYPGSNNSVVIMKIENYCYMPKDIIVEIRFTTDKKRTFIHKARMTIDGLKISYYKHDFAKYMKKEEMGANFLFNWGIYEGVDTRLFKFTSLDSYYKSKDVVQMEKDGMPLAWGAEISGIEGDYNMNFNKVVYSSNSQIKKSYILDGKYKMNISLAPEKEQSLSEVYKKAFIKFDIPNLKGSDMKLPAIVTGGSGKYTLYTNAVINEKGCTSQWLYILLLVSMVKEA